MQIKLSRNRNYVITTSIIIFIYYKIIWARLRSYIYSYLIFPPFIVKFILYYSSFANFSMRRDRPKREIFNYLLLFNITRRRKCYVDNIIISLINNCKPASNGIQFRSQSRYFNLLYIYDYITMHDVFVNGFVPLHLGIQHSRRPHSHRLYIGVSLTTSYCNTISIVTDAVTV